MKWSFASVGMIVLGIIGVMVIVLFQQITTSNENDYYLLKEITEASMIESIDLKYYRETGDLKIIKEKFVENFTRRYSESTLFIGTKYTISFFDIMEVPPKVTIMIDTGIENYRIYNNVDDYNIVNNLSSILEFTGKNTSSKDQNKVYKEDEYTQTVYSMLAGQSSSEPLNIPKEINDANMRNQKIIEVSSPEAVTDQGEILKARLRREIDWAQATNDDYRTNYFESMSNYSTDSNATIKYYNCSTDSGELNKLDCTKNLPWIGITRSSSDKVILKYQVKWSYEKYEYN